MMIKNNYGFKWNSFYRCDHGDEEIINLMAESGCEGVFLGLESGSDKILKAMNKTARRKHYQEAIPLLKRAGISTHANVIVGFPGETYETFKETLGLISEAEPDFFKVQLWYADPVTPIWKRKEEYGLKGSAYNWSHNTMSCQTACDLVKEMFFSIKNSLWSPQYGFQWSIFYLQRRGMTMKQVKKFAINFKEVIKEKLLYPDKKYIEPVLLNALKKSCMYDEADENDRESIEIYNTTNYTESREFWDEEYKGGIYKSNIDIDGDKCVTTNDQWGTVHCFVKDETVCNAGAHVLSAYSVLLSRLKGVEDTVIVSCFPGTDGRYGTMPIRLLPFWEMSFGKFAKNVEEKIQTAMQHKDYSQYFLNNSSYMEKHDSSGSPLFDVGYIYHNRKPEKDDLKEVMQSFPVACKKIGLVLEIFEVDNTINMQFSYSKIWFPDDFIEKLSTYLVSILNQTFSNNDMIIEEIILDYKRVNHDPSIVKSDNDEAFNF